MQKQKIVSALIILIIIAFVVPQITLAAWWNPFSWGFWNSIFHFQRETQKSEKLIGGDKDAHGCLPAAGYSWCEAKNKCLRTWEEKCEKAVDPTADWKTYTNTQYGFEIKYPKDSELKIYEKQPFSIEISKYADANGRCEMRGSTFDKRASYDGTPQNFDTTPNNIKRVIQDGRARYTIDTITADHNIGLFFDAYYTSNDKNSVYTTNECNNFLDQIMQTFKFTK